MTVSELPYCCVEVGLETIGSEVARLFDADKALPGVTVRSDGPLLHLVTRNQFFQRLGRLYGVEIYATRPIGFFLETVAVPPLVIAASSTVQAAVVACMERGEHVYDPFLVTLPGECPRIVTFESLILKQTELLSVAQVEAQAQRAVAVEANLAKSEFLAVMSHELRTPLTAIIGYGEILLEDVGTDDPLEIAPRLRNIVGAGLHLLEMINGILDLAKIEAGKTELAMEVFALPDFLEGLTETIAPLAAKNTNEFRLIVSDDLGDMYCDMTKLRQCLTNLLGNAAKFTSKGRVSLQVSREFFGGADWAIFEIADTGIGMSEAQMKKLFEPFYQADSSISRRFGGTGLGLSLTKRFSEMMGGTLAVRSAVDQGSTFTMRLPTGVEKPDAKTSPRRTGALPKVAIESQPRKAVSQ